MADVGVTDVRAIDVRVIDVRGPQEILAVAVYEPLPGHEQDSLETMGCCC
jgi:hypothetical protein